MSSAVCEPSRKLTWVKKMNAKVKSAQPAEDNRSGHGTRDAKTTKKTENK